MILIDTHIWVWWVTNSSALTAFYRSFLEDEREGNVAISIIFCWEVAKLSEKGKLQLRIPVDLWLEQALNGSKVSIIPLDIKIIVNSTKLPGNFHKDPADQLIVATARALNIELLTADSKILKYPHVKKIHL